jgi:hypothetical protein
MRRRRAEQYRAIEQTKLEQEALELGMRRRQVCSLGGIRNIVPRDSDRRVPHDSCTVDQSEIKIAVLLPPGSLIHATDLLVSARPHNQCVQVAEPPATQQLVDGDRVRPVPIRPIAELGQHWRQVLDPDWTGLWLIVPERGLVRHVNINRVLGFHGYGPGATEMILVGPGIVVIEEAEIGSICRRGTEVACEAVAMSLGPRDESKGLHADRGNRSDNGFICGLMLKRAAIIDHDDLDVAASLGEHGLQCLTEEGRRMVRGFAKPGIGTSG